MTARHAARAAEALGLKMSWLTRWGSQRLQRGSVRPQSVSGDRLGPTESLDHALDEFQCCGLVSALADKGFQHFAFVVHRAPEVVHLAIDLGYAPSGHLDPGASARG